MGLTIVWDHLWRMHHDTVRRLRLVNPRTAGSEVRQMMSERLDERAERDVTLADDIEQAPAEHIERLRPDPDGGGLKEEDPHSYTKRQLRGLIAGPILFLLILLLPAPSGLSVEGKRMAAVATLMAVYWMSEAIPIPATSLLPIPLFPWLGIMKTQKATAPYASHLIFLFMGGFIIALAMQRWNLHRRIALLIVNAVGFSPGRLIFGFMVATAALSAFVSNTATTVMMMPIGLAIVAHVVEEAKKEGLDIDTHPERFAFGLNLMLGIAYAASIGGIATLIGTPPNTVLAGYLTKTYHFDIGFARWMLVGVPFVLVFLPICWLWLTRFANPMKLKKVPGGREMIRAQLEELGPFTQSRGEMWTALIFALTSLAWIFRGPLTSVLEHPKMITDAAIAMTGGLLLFVIPINIKKNVFVLDWHWASKMPWGVLILFGGGLSLASGFKVTGLAAWIGQQVNLLENAPILLVVIAVSVLIIFLTELTSNTATAAMIMPILAAVAVGLGQSPLLLIVPAAIASSCAFMLPVATPPNAIVFGSGYVTIPQMMRAGLGLNLVGAVLTVLVTYLLVVPVFGVELGRLPEWVQAVAP